MEPIEHVEQQVDKIDKKSTGALVGSVIIILILVVGGIYIWQSKVKDAMQEKYEVENLAPEDEEGLDALESDVNDLDTSADLDVESVY